MSADLIGLRGERPPGFSSILAVRLVNHSTPFDEISSILDCRGETLGIHLFHGLPGCLREVVLQNALIFLPAGGGTSGESTAYIPGGLRRF